MKNIYVECRPDKILAKFILEKAGIKHKIIHEHGKTRIIKKVLSQKDSIGLIDEDPHAIPPPRIENFKLMSEEQEIQRFNFKVLKSPRDSILILLMPRLEEWIIRLSNLTKIRLDRYGLSNDPNHLHSTINFKLSNLEKYLDELSKSNEFKKIIQAIKFYLTK